MTPARHTSHSEVVRIFSEHTELGLFGFGTVRPPGHLFQFGALQQPLGEDFLMQVNTSRQWLREPTGAAVITRRGSYAIKHLIERASGTYISNGATITAALIEGFEIVRKSPGPNCSFKRAP